MITSIQMQGRNHVFYPAEWARHEKKREINIKPKTSIYSASKTCEQNKSHRRCGLLHISTPPSLKLETNAIFHAPEQCPKALYNHKFMWGPLHHMNL